MIKKSSPIKTTFLKYFSLAMYHASQMREFFAEYSTAYLCGHLHDGAGQITRMQHLHKSGLAELELGDWKYNRKFRILSFDHDLFSFTDFYWRKSDTFIHITNPPNWLLTNPEKQPIGKIGSSTHVRALIFSKLQLKKVDAIIDGKTVRMEQVENSNLWVAPWDPKSNEPGNVTVITYDDQNHSEKVSNFYNLHYSKIQSSKVNF